MMDLNSALSHLADEFLRDGSLDSDLVWGQFLDSPKESRHSGLYGACAGVIVLCLAERTQSTQFKRALEGMKNAWERRNKDAKHRENLSQNMRLAFLLLALALARKAAPSETKAIEPVLLDVRKQLLGRRVSEGCWGNYYADHANRDDIPNMVVTSVALIALSAARGVADDQEHLKALATLEGRIAKGFLRRSMDRAIATVAVLSWRGHSVSKQTAGHMKTWIKSHQIRIRRKDPFFVFYKYKVSGGYGWNRDYTFFIPSLIFAWAGRIEGSLPSLRLYAERFAAVFSREVDGSKVLKQGDEMASTVDQAWLAIFLGEAARSSSEKSVGLWSRLGYALSRSRDSGGFLVKWVYPLITSSVLTALSIWLGWIATNIPELSSGWQLLALFMGYVGAATVSAGPGKRVAAALLGGNGLEDR